ncbi:MAG: hypothetical protein IJT49_08180 [Clostridia bacterium]|nr:hypothetical protein [Clostridia bacterium]
MKKLPKFWNIYIITVLVIILLSCVFMIVLSVNLRNYEKTAQAQAAAKRESESARLLEEKDEAERRSGYGLSKRGALISAVKNASDLAEDHMSAAVDSSPERIMDATVASLNEKGISVLSGYLVCETGKYEDPASVSKYIDSLTGTYSYEMVSRFECTLKKGSLDAKVAFVKGEDDMFSISSVNVSLPLSSYKVTAPEGARLTVNGADVTEQPALEKQSFADMIPSSFSVPLIAVYEFDGFIYKPEIKAYKNDKECEAAETADTTVFTEVSDGKYKSELFDRVCELSFAYSDFVAGAFKFNEMSPYLYPGTKLYRNLSSFDNRWYYEFHHIVNENPKITNFTVLSKNLVSAHIEFNQSLRSEKDRTYNDIKIALTVYVGCDRVPTGEDKSAWLLVNVE